MKKNTFITGICTAVICLWGATACTDTSEQDLLLKSNSSTKAVEYNTVEISLSTPGTLAQELGDRANEVEKLILSGPINADDVLTIQSLSNILEAIDMRDVTIVESSTVVEDEYGDTTYEVQDNTIPSEMFADMLLSEIVLPENITGIEYAAFSGINGYYPLHITIPESVTTIEGNLFEECANLTSVQFSSNLQEIPDGTFSNCGRLESVTNISSVRYIDDRAFFYCTSLKQIELPECLQELGSWCFRESGLTSITIPDSVQNLGELTFFGCNSLQSIVLPQQVTTIPYQFLSSCSALRQIDIPNTVTTIGQSAFGGCTSLESIRIPENVTNIQESAFRGCSSLTSIEIPEGITEIPADMLSGCSSLSSVSLPESIRRLGDNAFSNCDSLKTIELPSNLREIGSSCFSGSGLTSIDLSGRVATLGDACFASCNSLETLTIPTNIGTVGVNILRNCYKLTSIIWEADINVPELCDGYINANCLLYISSENVEVEDTFIKNIIRNGVAENIELDPNGRGFNAPQAFKAKHISFTQTFDAGTMPGTSNGWLSIALPFTPTLITTDDGRTLAPFNSEMADAKPFWLRRMTDTGFENMTELEAGIPYIIAMPNNPAYLPEYNISGEVTFSAQSDAGIDIPVTETQITRDQGPEFSLTTFYGYQEWDYDYEAPNIYLLSDRDGYFRHARYSYGISPFQCYATLNSGTASPAFFSIDGSKAATRSARPLGPVPNIDDM